MACDPTPPLPTPLAAVEAMALEEITRAYAKLAGIDFDALPDDMKARSVAQTRGLIKVFNAAGYAVIRLDLYPGVAEVIAGSAVVVPAEPTQQLYMRIVGSALGPGPLLNYDRPRFERWARDYRDLVAASPYAPPAPGAEEKPA